MAETGAIGIYKRNGHFEEVFAIAGGEGLGEYLDQWLGRSRIIIGGTAVQAVRAQVASGSDTFKLEPPIPGDDQGVNVAVTLASDLHAEGFGRVDIIESGEPGTGGKVLHTVKEAHGPDLDELGIGVESHAFALEENW